MSSSIPSPACRIAVISYSSHRHLVLVPSSSRIRYWIIPQCNPSHAIPDTTTLASVPLISPPHLIAPTASRPASRRTVSPDGSTQGTTPSDTLLVCLFISARLIGSSVPTVACYAPTHAAARHLIHLIGASPVPLRFPSYFPPSVQPRLVPSDCPPSVQLRLAPSHRFIFLPVACPSHSSHRLIARISSLRSIR